MQLPSHYGTKNVISSKRGIQFLMCLNSNHQCISALETCRRHVPMLWCGFVWGQWKITGGNDYGSVDKCWGHRNKNIKYSLLAKWNASHLAVRLCVLRHWKRVSMPPTTQSLRHPLTRAIHIAPRIKTVRRFTANPPLMIT